MGLGKFILPIRRGPNSEGSRFSLIWKSHILPIRRRPNSEGLCFGQSGGVLFPKSGGLPIRRVLLFAYPEGSLKADPERLRNLFYERNRKVPNTFVNESKTFSE